MLAAVAGRLQRPLQAACFAQWRRDWDVVTRREAVLPRVKAYHDSIGVPFGHWQFDSWFYPKDGGVNPGGGGGAVVENLTLGMVLTGELRWPLEPLEIMLCSKKV